MELEKGVASTEILASTEGANKPFKADVLKTNKKRWLSIGGVIIAVVIALIIAIVVMNSDQNTSEGAALENETSEGKHKKNLNRMKYTSLTGFLDCLVAKQSLETTFVTVSKTLIMSKVPTCSN